MNSLLNSPNQDSHSMVPSRRRFVLSAMASAFGLSVADLLVRPGSNAAAQPPPAGCSQQFDKFVPVAEFKSQNKTLALTMTVKGTTRNVATIAGQGYQCRSMRLRYYDAQVGIPPTGAKWPENVGRPGPGPTLRARVGDRIHVNLVNSLNPAFFGRTDTAKNGCDLKTTQNGPLYPGKDELPSCFHGDNSTNMHYHGTHVTPDKKGDNVMVDVPVGGNYENDFELPTDPPPSNSTDFTVPFKMGQAPGTHWYHAHKHGSVALQLLNGMAGAFIIEGEFDDQLETLMPGLNKTEKVLVIQQLGETITIQPGTPLNTCAGGDPLPLVNGQLQPTIEMRPGEIQRWRFVNATMQQVSHLTYRFLGEQAYNASKGSTTFPANPGYVPAIRQIAYDGVQLAPERYNDAAFGLSGIYDRTSATGSTSRPCALHAGNIAARVSIAPWSPARRLPAEQHFRSVSSAPQCCGGGESGHDLSDSRELPEDARVAAVERKRPAQQDNQRADAEIQPDQRRQPPPRY